MSNYRNAVMFFAVVLAVISAASVFAQTDTTTPIRTRQGVIDANGDGICDITGRTIGSGGGLGQGQQARKGPSRGLGNGTGNGAAKQSGMQRGGGFGSASCTGTGRASGGGRMNRGGRR